MEFIWDCLLDAALDTLKLLPLLFLTYLLMEYVEHKTGDGIRKILSGAGKIGPFAGGIAGLLPQCGMSAAASSLYAGRMITLGTLLAIYLSTSDEMLPIFLSALTDRSISVTKVLWIVGGKAALGIALGYLADLLLRKVIRPGKDIHSFCEREHCHCEEKGHPFLSALKSAAKHTLKIAVILIGVNFILNLLFLFVGIEKLSGWILSRPVIGVVVLALFGLIPNCSVSVVLTRSYLSGIIGLGGLFAGLLSNAGIGLIVLIRNNKNRRENLIITGTLYVLSVLAGIVISLFFS